MFLMDILHQLKKQTDKATCALLFDVLIDVLHQLKKQTDKAICVFLFDVFNGFSTSIKEINRLIWKEMPNY